MDIYRIADSLERIADSLERIEKYLLESNKKNEDKLFNKALIITQLKKTGLYGEVLEEMEKLKGKK